MAICAAATCIYMLLPAGTPGWALYGVLGTLGLFGVGWFPLFILQIAEIAPRSAIASTVSFSTTLCMIAMSVVPFLFGTIVDVAGYRLAWSILILPVAILAVFLVRLPVRKT
jgi:hypothetical protein